VTLASYVRPVVSVSLGDGVVAAASLLRNERVGRIVVTRDGRPIGIFTDRDLALRVVADARSPQATRVEDIMTFDPITLPLSETVDSAVRCMREHGVRRIPIVDDAGAVVGIVTADDLFVDLGRQLAAVGEAIAEPADSEDSR